MATSWTNPTQITQYCEPGAENIHIPWDDSNGFSNLKSNDSSSVTTNGTLYHIARSPKTDRTTKTFFIKATGYNFTNLPDVISGVELRFTGNRRGRITDDTIQLCYNGELIGENQANAEIDTTKLYGGNTNLWGVELTKDMVNDSSFGVVIRLKSHPKWPHRDGAFINSLELLIH